MNPRILKSALEKIEGSASYAGESARGTHRIGGCEGEVRKTMAGSGRGQTCDGMEEQFVTTRSTNLNRIIHLISKYKWT